MDDTGARLSPDALYGTILRSFRKGGLRETAAKIPINFSHLAKWERGERPVPEEMVPALDRVYAANGALITLHELIERDRARTRADAARPMWPGTGPAALGGEAHRAARRLFPAISAATGTPAQTLDALEAAEELAGGVRAAITQRDGIDLEEWERLVWDRGLACGTTHPGALLGQLTLDYARASRLLAHNTVSATSQVGLLRAAARLAALVAMQWSDLAQQALAVCYWELARAAADASGERDLQVWVRTWQAHHGYGAQCPELSITRLIDEAITIADDAPSTGLALAYATRALLTAGRGDAEGTRAALRNFATVADRLPTGTTSDHALPLWDLPSWTRAYHRAYPCLLIGDTTQAIQAITEAEKLCPPHFPGYIADLRFYRAHALIIDCDIDRGLDLALTAAQSWPLTTTRRHLLAGLLKALPAEAYAHPTVRTLHHLI